jgi:hypothetical protein
MPTEIKDRASSNQNNLLLRKVFMPFHSFGWTSEIISFAVQLAVFFKVRQVKSFRLWLALLCLGNVLSVLTRNHAVLYWDQLYIGRIVCVLVGLWAVADISCYYEGQTSPILRLPVIVAALLAYKYWPLNPESGIVEMETYRYFGLGLAVFIVALHVVFLIAGGRRVNFQLCVLGCLAAEGAGSAAVVLFGWVPRFQMFAWLAGLSFLAAFAVHQKGFFHTDPDVPEDQSAFAPGQTVGHGSPPDAALRLQLSARLPCERQVFSSYNPQVQSQET